MNVLFITIMVCALCQRKLVVQCLSSLGVCGIAAATTTLLSKPLLLNYNHLTESLHKAESCIHLSESAETAVCSAETVAQPVGGHIFSVWVVIFSV